MREEIGEVVLRVRLDVTDRVVVFIVPAFESKQRELVAQPNSEPDHIPVREPVRTIVSGDALPFSKNPNHEDDGEVFDLAIVGDPPNPDASLPVFDRPFLFRHRCRMSGGTANRNDVPGPAEHAKPQVFCWGASNPSTIRACQPRGEGESVSLCRGDLTI